MLVSITQCLLLMALFLVGLGVFYFYFQSRKYVVNEPCRDGSSDLAAHDSDSELNISDRFLRSQLRIVDDLDDHKSCSSTESRFTFYSVVITPPET